MARYDVYGVGNALVDIEFDVDEAFLDKANVDKGLMTLIEEDRHHQLLDQLGDRERRMMGGGSAANTIVAATQLGAQAFYSCRVADDSTGHFFIDELAKLGIDSNLNADNLVEGVTGKCLVLITPDADRSMNTFLGATRQYSIGELDEEAIRHSDYLYIEGYLVPEINARAAAVRAREIAVQSHVKTSLTLSDPNMVQFFGDGLREIAGDQLDMCFSNEAEASLLFGVNNLNDCVEGMKTLSNRFAITLGARGAVLWDGQDLHETPAPPVDAIDTNGAGDMYAGTFLYGLTHGLDFRNAGELAIRAASHLVTQYGARLDTASMQELLRSYG